MSAIDSTVPVMCWPAETTNAASHGCPLHAIAIGYQSTASSAMIVTADVNGGLRLWQWRDGFLKYARRMQTQGGIVTSMAVPNPASSLLVTADSAGVKCWDMRVGVLTCEFPGTAGAQLIALSDDGTLCAVTIPATGELLVFDVEQKELIAQRSDCGRITAMAFTKFSDDVPEPCLIVQAEFNGISMLSGETLDTLIDAFEGSVEEGTEPRTATIAISPDGTLLSTMTPGESKVEFWSVATGRLISTATFGADLSPRCLQYNPERYWATVIDGKAIVSWDLVERSVAARFDPVPPTSSADDEEIGTGEDEEEEVANALVQPIAMEWMADGSVLFVAYRDGRMRWFRDPTSSEQQS